MPLDELPYSVYKDKGVQLASFRLQSVQKSVSAKRGVGVRRVGGWYCRGVTIHKIIVGQGPNCLHLVQVGFVWIFSSLTYHLFFPISLRDGLILTEILLKEPKETKQRTNKPTKTGVLCSFTGCFIA